MGLWDTVKIFFTGMISIYIDFNQNCFSVLVSKNGKPASYRDIKSNEDLQRYLPNPLPINDNPHIIISLDDAERLYTDVSAGRLPSRKVEVVFSENAQNVYFQSLHNELQFQYLYDSGTGCLHKVLPEGVVHLTGDYYLQDKTILHILDRNLSEVLQNEKITGKEILKLVQSKGIPGIYCNLTAGTDAIILLSAQVISEQQMIISKQQLVPYSQLSPLSGLPDRVVYNYKIHKIIPLDLEKDIFQGEQIRVLSGTEIPDFADKYDTLITQFGDQNIKGLLNRDDVFVNRSDLKFILSCHLENKNGVGKGMATPMLRYGEKLISAKEVSEQQINGYVKIGNKWLTKNVLEALGIGPLGRLIDGTPLASIELKSDEIVNRGSERLAGPWSEFLFDESPWKTTGTPEEIFFFHMEFLRTHGINGGVALSDILSSPALFVSYVRSLEQVLVNGGKALILLKKKYYDECLQHGGFGTALVFKNQKNDPSIPTRLSGVVICFYNHVEKFPAISNSRWDLLIMAEPDTIFKTNRSAVYTNTKSISAKLRLGVFTVLYDSFSNQQELAINELFRISRPWDYKLRRYLVRDVAGSLPLPTSYQFRIRTLIERDMPFTVTVSGTEAKGIPIPKRQKHVANFGGIQLTITSSFETSQGNFRRQAQQLANVSVDRASFVPFMSYWPTYNSMDEAQKKWYFYWRTQIRKGNYIQTDTSYIFVYVYELINGIGYTNSLEGYYKLYSVWQAYRESFPKLDNYLPDWIFDFLILHQLEDKLSELIQGCHNIQNSTLFNVYIQKHYIEQNDSIAFSDINAVASYRMERSKFCLEGHSALMCEKAASIFNKINKEMLDRFQKNLFQMFCPAKTVLENKRCYASAVYDGNESYSVEYLNFISHKPLTGFIDSILRYTENKLREQIGFKGRLRSIDIDDVWKQSIDAEFSTFKPHQEVQKQPVAIQLHADEIDKLRAESDELRDILLIKQQEIEQTDHSADKKQQKMEHEPPGSSSKRLLTDLAEISALLKCCDDEKNHILKLLYENNWGYGIAELSNILGNSMADMIVDEINALGIKHVGTIIIATEQNQYILEDDFRDEFEHIYSQPELFEKEPENHSEQDPLVPFLSGLNDFQLEILRLLLTKQAGAESLEQMALMNGTMPEIIFDEINELFQIQTGDLIIDALSDPPEIAEEYQPVLQEKLEKAAI